MKERLHRLGAIIRADFLIRLRRPSTLVVFLLLSFSAYFWIPSPSTGRALLVVNGHRALYNSAAIGMSTALTGTIFIGLFGFYVISNALRRDVLSRCGYVIASTTMRGSEYIAGKFAGNLAFLGFFTLGYMLTAMAMVLVRGEAPLEPLVFAKQYVLLIGPALVFVSAIAIVFECTPVLRSKFGDVLYFFLWMSVMGFVAAATEQGFGLSWTPYIDFSGFGFMMQQVKDIYKLDSMSIGASSFDPAKSIIVFEGLDLRGKWFLPRIVATIWPLFLLGIARLLFHRFDPSRVRSMPNEKARRSWIGRFNLIAKPLTRPVVRVGQMVASLPGIPALLRSMMTDAIAALAAFPLWGVAIVVVAMVTLGSDATGLFTGVLPAATAVCAIALSDIACREKRAGTSALVFATPSLRQQFVWWKLGTAFFVALAFLGIPIVRAIAFRPSSALPLLLGVVFMAATATALGIVSANPKTFIVVFLSFWYVVLSDKGATPALDFSGWFGKATPMVLAAYAMAAAGLLVAAQLAHASELRRKW